MGTLMAVDCFVLRVSVRQSCLPHADAGYGVFLVRPILVGDRAVYSYRSLAYIDLRLPPQEESVRGKHHACDSG